MSREESLARDIGEKYKLIYTASDKKWCAGVGIVLDEDLKSNVLNVNKI